MYQRANFRLGQEVPLVDCDARDRAQGLQISLLADWLAGIELAADRRCEVTNALDIVIRIEKTLCQCLKVQPFVRCAAKRPVIEIEPVYINVGPFQRFVRSFVLFRTNR